MRIYKMENICKRGRKVKAALHTMLLDLQTICALLPQHSTSTQIELIDNLENNRKNVNKMKKILRGNSTNQ
jgi:hypothetical protein